MELPALLKLSADDLQFVDNFVRASGSLKEMARLRAESYPTIRNRLNEIIEKLEGKHQHAEQRQVTILESIAQGELSVKDAIKRLKEAFD